MISGRTTSRNPSLWFPTVGVQPPAPDVRLVCFAHAGGSDSAFAGWARMVPEGVAVTAAAFPGRGRRFRESPLTDWSLLISCLADGLGQPGPPFVLFGHSLGALVAYEVTRELQRRGARLPSQLIVAGCDAPPELLAEGRPEPGTDADIIAMMRRLGGTPEEVFAERDLLELFLPVMRADFTLLASYDFRPGESISCPLAVYVGATDPETSASTVPGWFKLAAGPTTARTFDGGHFFVTEQAAAVVQAVTADARFTTTTRGPA